MDNNIFRQKSIDQISSTEELHDYLQVTSPKLWMLLSVILALVVGFIVYASTVTMENTVQAKADVAVDIGDDDNEEMNILMTIPEMYKDVVKVDMYVRIGGEIGQIKAIFNFEEDTQAVVELYDEDEILPNGTYDATIIIETVTPFSFLFN